MAYILLDFLNALLTPFLDNRRMAGLYELRRILDRAYAYSGVSKDSKLSSVRSMLQPLRVGTEDSSIEMPEELPPSCKHGSDLTVVSTWRTNTPEMIANSELCSKQECAISDERGALGTKEAKPLSFNRRAMWMSKIVQLE